MNDRQRVPPTGPVPVYVVAIVDAIIGAAIPVAPLLIEDAFRDQPEGVSGCLTGVVFFTPMLAVAGAIVGALTAATFNDFE